MSQVSDFFQQLGLLLGMESLKVNHQGHLTLMDDDIPVDFQICDNQAMLCVYFEVGKLNDEVSKDTLELLLMANYFGVETQGFNLALEADSRALVLSRLLPVAAISPGDVVTLLEAIPSIAEEIRALITLPLEAHSERQVNRPNRDLAVEQMIRV